MVVSSLSCKRVNVKSELGSTELNVGSHKQLDDLMP